jgi:hypothetical protein
VVRDYRDSQSGLDTKCPKYRAMIETFERQEAFHLILWGSQCLGRDELEFIDAMFHLMDIGVTVHDTSQGMLSRNDVARLAYEAGKEARRNSRRTYSKQRLRARKGQPQSRLPLGLLFEYDHNEKGDRIRPDRVVMDPKAGPAVQRCFRNYLAMESTHAMTERLNAELGTRMSVRGVSRPLQNRLYKGVYVWGRRNCGLIIRKEPRTPDQWGVRPQQGAQLSAQHLVQAPEDVRGMQAEIEWDRRIVHNLMLLRHPDHPLCSVSAAARNGRSAFGSCAQ